MVQSRTELVCACRCDDLQRLLVQTQMLDPLKGITARVRSRLARTLSLRQAGQEECELRGLCRQKLLGRLRRASRLCDEASQPGGQCPEGMLPDGTGHFHLHQSLKRNYSA